MFILLLFVLLVLAAGVCFVIAQLFKRPLGAILGRLVSETLAAAWQRYITFAIYVVGISGGVRIWELERYLTGSDIYGKPLELTAERWTLEIYSTLVSTLRSVAWMLFAFFMIALIAHVILRGFEVRREHSDDPRGVH